jgi:hypothetical protein
MIYGLKIKDLIKKYKEEKLHKSYMKVKREPKKNSSSFHNVFTHLFKVLLFYIHFLF